MALTDHDTTAGLDEALEAGSRHDVEVIPGIEVSVKYEPGTMHILGYFIDHHSATLQQELEPIQNARRERNPELVRKLRAAGLEITLEEVLAESGGGQVGRPHFARVLVKKGYVRNLEEAFAKYLVKGTPFYVDKRRVSPEEGIGMITATGGIAVLAHPKYLRARSPLEFEAVLDRLIACGLRGVEAFSSSQNEEEARFYREAAESRGLWVTGGSDFHGANKPHVELGRMGDWAELDYELVEGMRDAAGKRA
jgi:predicted metal-dependent phosphoesterase TrpH